MPKSITVDKKYLLKLLEKVKSGEITLDQYQTILLNNTLKQKEEKPKTIIKKEKRDIEEINNMAHSRKKQIKKWKKDNPGKTELEQINSNPKLVQEKINRLLKLGATVIENPKYSDIEDVKEKLGKRLIISYILKDGKYRSGGFLTANSDYYFALLGGQIGAKISFSVQYSNVKTIYVRKITKKPVKPVQTEHPKTKYPIKVGKIVVYYARDNYDRRRFMNTQKYAQMLKYNKKKLA
jgi:hypothetical protein